jgi:hypothetical protein
VDEYFFLFLVAGFSAQMIDGALGMAYGVSSTSLLLSFGVSPAAASASVHTAEIFTAGVSGASHWKLGNVDRALFRRLVIPGVMGGVVGAYVLSELPGEKLKPWVAAYLLVMGLLIIRKAFGKTAHLASQSGIRRLGLAGGFLDAIGGGGWGPVVTTTLVANGHSPRQTIGSVNLAEFFVTVAQAATFFLTVGLVHWQIIAGLMVGGVLAAPLAAHVCKRMPAKPLMLLVGILIIVLSLRTIWQSIT